MILDTEMCTKCHEQKPLIDFYIDKRHKNGHSSICKRCTIEKQKEYQKREQLKLIEYRKKYYELNKNTICERTSNYYKTNIETIRVKAGEYRQQNKEMISNINKKYYLEKKDEILIKNKEYRENNREKIRNLLREYHLKNRDELNTRHKEYNKDYYTTFNGKQSILKHNTKRRSLGFDPINSFFEGSEFHHLHVNGNRAFGVYIPKELHRSRYHDGVSGYGMKMVNVDIMAWVISNSVANALFLKRVVIGETPEHLRRLMR